MPIDDLLEPARLWSREEVIASRTSRVPKSARVYAWYCRQIPGSIDVSRCHTHGGMPMLYVGIAPKKPYADARRSTTSAPGRAMAITRPTSAPQATGPSP
jgi:hypothetical protein